MLSNTALGPLPLLCQRRLPNQNRATETQRIATTEHKVPLLVKYLLLSAYVCQVNNPDKDRQLFSIQKNGRKRRGGGGANAEEEAAFGSSAADRLKSLRPRTYPAERLYSLYVSMVSLNASNDLLADDNGGGDDEALKSLGNIHFFEMVAHLKSLGILHDYPKRSPSDTIRLSQRSFWSSITKDEAQQVAKSVNFPLEKYVL